MKKIITTAKEEIQKAKTVDDVTKLYNQAKSDYNTAYLTSMRAAYEKKLDFASALDKAQTYVGMYPDDADGQKEVAFLKTRTGA